jgi:MoaA/NifB/PqqE/SkfB family radical SAM enzyme
VIDRKKLEHIRRAHVRFEDLWAKGIDYSSDDVEAARAGNELLHLDMDFTGECQLKCFYCDRTPDRYSDVPRRVELTTEQRKDIISQAKELGGETVEFPGAGEPMIDPGFWEVLEHITDLGMTSVIFTSGYHLNDLAIDRLYELSATVIIKHNSDDPRIADKMVGVKGYGEIANRALQRMVDKGFAETIPTRVGIDMVTTPHFNNLEEIGNIFTWCRDRNVHVYITTLIPEGMGDHKSLLFEKERANQLINYIAKIDREEYGLEYEPVRPIAAGYRCRQVNVGLFVNLFGEVYDCNGLGRLIGHLRTNTVADIWNSQYARKIREPIQDGFCLLREREWQGVDLSAMERKVEQYDRWRGRHGGEQVMENALAEVGQIDIRRRGAVDIELLPSRSAAENMPKAGGCGCG